MSTTASNPIDSRKMRRLAAAQGFALRKSRRDGTYMIVNPWVGNVMVAGNSETGYGLTIEDAVDWLRDWMAQEVETG